MFLRGSPDLAPVSLLASPQLERPFCTPKATATSSPAGCLVKGQPRDNTDGASDVVYANQDWGRKTRPNFSVKEKPYPVHTRIHVRRNANAMGRAPIFLDPSATRNINHIWEEKTRPSFSVKENLFPVRQVRRKINSTPIFPPSCISSPNMIDQG